MSNVNKYYRAPQVNPDVEGDERARVIGFPEISSDFEHDEESAAAMAYIQSVQQESKSLPFAVVADIPSEPARMTTDSESVNTYPRNGESQSELSGISAAIIEYFISLRMLLKKDSFAKRDVLIDFGGDVSETLTVAESVSITNAIEDLSEVTDVLAPEVIAEWLFGLLVYLEEPLLEDTAAALQTLRRFCSTIQENELTRSKLEVCSIIIREYFKQR
jgi:hypothetical protein